MKCPRCKGEGYIDYVYTMHGERNIFGRERCYDCLGSGITLPEETRTWEQWDKAVVKQSPFHPDRLNRIARFLR
jgi:hypothetical protein